MLTRQLVSIKAAITMAQKFVSGLWHAIKSKNQSPPPLPPPPRKSLPQGPPSEAPTTAKPEAKPEPRHGLEEKHAPTETAITSGRGTDKSKQKQSTVKEVSASSSQKADEQQLEKGELEEQHSSGERIWGFFRHPFGNHPPPPNHRPIDEEQGLKR
jgi:hypothetical protein